MNLHPCGQDFIVVPSVRPSANVKQLEDNGLHYCDNSFGKISKKVPSHFKIFYPSLLACEAVSSGKWFQTFRRIVMPSSSAKILFDAKDEGITTLQNAGHHSPHKV
jgi:hypothetical protein